MIEMIYPAGWGKKDEPMTRAEFDALKAAMLATMASETRGTRGISEGAFKVQLFPKQAPFIGQAVRELVESGHLERRSNVLYRSYPPVTWRLRGERG